VRHVGQELGLVARRRRQFVAVAHQLALRDQQRLLLRLQLVGALFQLHVALFQLGLLFFQMALRLRRLRLCSSSSSLAAPQLFLLGLQLLALALRFFQQHHQLRAQQRCAQGHADGLGTALQQLAIQIALFTDPGASQFDDDHGTIAADRRRMRSRTGSRPRLVCSSSTAIVAMQVADAFVPSHLPGHALLQCQRRRHPDGNAMPPVSCSRLPSSR
jgi:hypothetical protein